MVTPLVHMGSGYDDLLVPALVTPASRPRTSSSSCAPTPTSPGCAGTRRAPRPCGCRMPPRAGPTSCRPGAPRRAEAGLRRRRSRRARPARVSERAVRRNRVDTAMNFLNLAAEELEAAIAGRGPVLALVEFTVTSELLTAGLVTHHGGLATWPRGMRLPADRFGLIGAPKGHHPVGAAGRGPDGRRGRPRHFIATLAGRAGRPMGFARNLKVETGQEIWRLASDRIKRVRRRPGRATSSCRSRSTTRACPWLNPVKARLNLREYQEPPLGPPARALRLHAAARPARVERRRHGSASGATRPTPLACSPTRWRRSASASGGQGARQLHVAPRPRLLAAVRRAPQHRRRSTRISTRV